MSTTAIPVLTTSVTADTNANPNTVVSRDSVGGIYGTVVNASALQTTGTRSGNVVSKTASFTAGAATDYLCDATAGAMTCTLPTASANTGVVYNLIKTDASVNVVTLSTVTGSVTSLASQWNKARIVSNGTSWYSV